MPLLALLIGAGSLLGCGNQGSASQVRESPAEGTSPQETVSAYLNAINAHDKTAGRALSTPYFAKDNDGVQDNPFDNWQVTAPKLGAVIPQPDYESPDGKRYQE